MSLRGQRFEIDLDADDFTPKPLSGLNGECAPPSSLIGEIKERSPNTAPVAPQSRDSKTGFPAHRKRSNVSAFKQRRPAQVSTSRGTDRPQSQDVRPLVQVQNPPSDKAIAHHIGEKYGYNFDTKDKQDISKENKQRMAAMSEEDIEEARAELMSSLNPAFIEKLLKRANIDEETDDQQPTSPQENSTESSQQDLQAAEQEPSIQTETRTQTEKPPSQSEDHLVPPIHFPQPPISPSTFTPLDPTSPSFLHDLKTHYFPSTPHSPTSLTWLTDPSEQENHDSPYNPSKENYEISQLRFSFTGTLIPPTESLTIPTDRGLHHHGLAPSSAGYTVPELAILSHSALPSQRCVAYQVLGRMMYRLGRAELGAKGSELCEGLWEVVERERVVEVMMAEANRAAGHASAKAYAVEALWLWRRGCGGERGLLGEGGVRAK